MENKIALMEEVVEFDGNRLLNYEPIGDHFVVEIPDVNPFLDKTQKIRKTEKQIAEEVEKMLGEYFKVVAVGPKCDFLEVGDNVFMIPPQRVVSFKAKFGETHKRFAIFKEYVVLGKLSK